MKQSEKIKEYFVSIEIAEKLKQIGFDKDVLFAKNKNKVVAMLDARLNKHLLEVTDFYPKDYNYFKDFISLPTLEQVFKWFRDKDFFGFVTMTQRGKFSHIIYILKPMVLSYGITEIQNFETYEEAQQDMIKKMIEFYKLENGI